MWTQLLQLLDHPLVERFPQLKANIIQSLERDIQISLYINQVSQSHWLGVKNPPWAKRRQTLISEGNEAKVLNILAEIQKL